MSLCVTVCVVMYCLLIFTFNSSITDVVRSHTPFQNKAR